MTQVLLQACGWYGVFLVTTEEDPVPDGDGSVKRVMRLSQRIRPLLGWASAEGGFQGLYYYEADRRLATSTRIGNASNGNDILIGDFITDPLPIQGALIQNVLDAAKIRYETLQLTYTVHLSDDVRKMLEKNRIEFLYLYQE